ncbi:tetratricopeptide repeat protein [Streptomyces canus]|uniref:tetratricopeptide repeat protein n=1 Tax=Streptomyces canus TaxID=58343 RepID=UPI0036BE0249
MRGRLHRRAERNEAALADLTTALALEPQHSDALVERAITHAQMGHTADALADMDDAIRARPDAEAHVVRGHINLTAGHRDAALADFNHALELDPEHEWARGGQRENDIAFRRSWQQRVSTTRPCQRPGHLARATDTQTTKCN